MDMSAIHFLRRPFSEQNSDLFRGDLMKIGIAGIGKMGAAIGTRLLGQGYDLTVWNRSSPKAQGLLDAGAKWAHSPQALTASVDVVLTLLTDESALDDVYAGPGGLLAQLPAIESAHEANGQPHSAHRKIFIDMSTVQPTKSQDMAAKISALGAVFLECPVGGSVGPAKEGKLLGFVGGDAVDLQKVLPLLQTLCKRVEHVGQHGAGATMKLAVNLPLMVYWQTLSEALSLVAPLGLDPQRVIDILSDSSGGPNMLKVRGAMIAQTLKQKKSDQVTVNVATMRKDLRTMVAQGQRTQRALPLTALALEKFNQAAQNGLDDKDCTELPVWWLDQGGVAR
jgi:3-hydroxyisobutyrate dehydrogenase